jgi:hypothetical protein
MNKIYGIFEVMYDGSDGPTLISAFSEKIKAIEALKKYCENRDGKHSLDGLHFKSAGGLYDYAVYEVPLDEP